MAKQDNILLVVEDDPGLQKQLKWCFDDFEVVIVGDRKSAINAVRKYEPSVVTLDLGLPPDPANVSEGFAALDEILGIAPHTKVIVVTGNDDRENALKAIDLGAYDFYQKPIDPDVLKIIVDRAYKLYEVEHENRQFVYKKSVSPLDGIITSSPEMLEVCEMVEKVAATDATILLSGESGTGKELLAKALHSLSTRANKRFVAINCAAIPDTLLESELFGYEKGAFTGANKTTLGKIEVANDGTLFLDEIGDLPQPLQAKLLRFLQERVIERIGGRNEIPIDTRIICATHRRLDEMILSNEFREDLYYRISEIIIEIPPLSERTGDPVMLAWAFLREYAGKNNKKVKGMTQDALIAIDNYEWPGNVRELENKIKRAVIMANGTKVSAKELQLTKVEGDMPLNLKEVREKSEAQAILRALSNVQGNVSKASELLGVSRPTLYDLMNKYNLK